ncbi:MAG: glycosyltransferase [Cyclobacteriaceae bacterium]|nr:glycosyltransferase [Cyclobacteriaceae bacterium]
MTAWTVIFYLFVSCTAIQLFYWLKVFGALAFKQIPEAGATPAQPVSVIICAHNELDNLKVLIPALRQQEYANFQVLVALDRSTDNSLTWLQQQNWERLNILDFKEIPDKVNGKKYALLQAIQAADHPHLLLTDADCYPRSNQWIALMAAGLQANNELVLGFSPYEKRPGLLNTFIRYETLLTGIQYLSRALQGDPYMGVGRNLAYTKEFFNNTHQLKPYLRVPGGDDDLLVNHFARGERTGICIKPAAHMISRPKSSLKDYLIQKKRHLAVGKHYKYYHKLVLGIFSLTHIIFWSSLVSLLVTTTHLALVLVLFLIRQITLSVIVSRSAKQLSHSQSLSSLVFLDFLFGVYYLYTGLVALTSKKVNWH